MLGDGEAVDNELVDDVKSESQGTLAQDSCISPGMHTMRVIKYRITGIAYERK